jgi:hypothetical protein
MVLTVSPEGRGLQHAFTALLLLLRATAISGEKRLVSARFRLAEKLWTCSLVPYYAASETLIQPEINSLAITL